MDSTQYTVTLDEFKLFHGIDRSMYVVLVRELGRNPLECLYIMGLWLWLERGGFYNFVSKVLPLPLSLINELADEAVACLKCTNFRFPFSSEGTEIPLTHSIAEKDISLQFFYDRQFTAFREIESLINAVCIPLLSDIIEIGGYHGTAGFTAGNSMQRPEHGALASFANAQMLARSSIDNSALVQSISSLRLIMGDSSSSHLRAPNEISRNERTMFVTFSKGYPVTENEVRLFFTRLFGNCIESFHMQEVKPAEQALYAKVVFTNPSFIRTILNGVTKAKFTINGKHVWMRKFVPKSDMP